MPILALSTGRGPAVARAISKIMKLGADGIKNHRSAAFNCWRKRAEELKDEEAKRKAGLYSDIRTVIQKKRVLLFREILEAVGYHDLAVGELLMTAIGIIGE